MANTEQQHWEATLKELTRLAEKFPSPAIYQKLADCYKRLGEREEADIMMDFAHSIVQQNGFNTNNSI